MPAAGAVSAVGLRADTSISGTRLGLSATRVGARERADRQRDQAGEGRRSDRERAHGAAAAAMPEPRREADEQRRQREQQAALDEAVGVPGGEDADLERPRPPRA